MKPRSISIIAHDIRSAHNVGALLRLADGLGVSSVYLTGYTPYPPSKNDKRLPHVTSKLLRQIHKTALGAENSVTWQHQEDITQMIKDLKKQGSQVIALEQVNTSVKLGDFKPPDNMCVLLGREVEGVQPELLKLCDKIVEIPMLGKKESHNVVAAAAIALAHCRFTDNNVQ